MVVLPSSSSSVVTLVAAAATAALAHGRPEHRVRQHQRPGRRPPQRARALERPALRDEGDDEDGEEVAALAQHPEVGADHEVVEEGVEGLAGGQRSVGPARDGAHLAQHRVVPDDGGARRVAAVLQCFRCCC